MLTIPPLSIHVYPQWLALSTWVVLSLPVEHEKQLWECALHGKNPPGGRRVKKRALDAAQHKSCHRGECEGGASSLFWQQTKASIPTNLLLEKIGTSCCQVFPTWHLLISSPPQLCVCPVCLVLRTRATTPLTGFAPPSLANLAPTILSWLQHRSVSIHTSCFMALNSLFSGQRLFLRWSGVWWLLRRPCH